MIIMQNQHLQISICLIIVQTTICVIIMQILYSCQSHNVVILMHNTVVYMYLHSYKINILILY